MYRFLSPEEVSEFFENLEIDEEDYEALFETMNATYASQVLEQMSYDNAVDILNQLSKKENREFINVDEPRRSKKEIKALLHYDEDTAGGIMTTEYISLTINTPVHEALMRVKDQAPDAETIYVIFVVDEDKKN